MPIYVSESDNNLIVHAGFGDLVIGCNTDIDEVIITPAEYIVVPGETTTMYDGKHTGEIPPGVRLAFEHEESLRVLIECLQKVQTHLYGPFVEKK